MQVPGRFDQALNGFAGRVVVFDPMVRMILTSARVSGCASFKVSASRPEGVPDSATSRRPAQAPGDGRPEPGSGWRLVVGRAHLSSGESRRGWRRGLHSETRPWVFGESPDRLPLDGPHETGSSELNEERGPDRPQDDAPGGVQGQSAYQ